MPTMIASSTVALVALTEEAARALGAARMRFRAFSVKVGRERRSTQSDATLPPGVSERRRGEAPQLNDVYLVEASSGHRHISGEHFSIECMDSLFVLVDRCSACGTIVAGKRIGGSRQGGRTELRNGDTVVVGTSKSPYVFQFEISSE